MKKWRLSDSLFWTIIYSTSLTTVYYVYEKLKNYKHNFSLKWFIPIFWFLEIFDRNIYTTIINIALDDRVYQIVELFFH